MAGCCGGKNAGKPISRPRYLAGLVFFTAYHSTVHSTLLLLSLASNRCDAVRRFHRLYFQHLLREALSREGITLSQDK